MSFGKYCYLAFPSGKCIVHVLAFGATAQMALWNTSKQKQQYMKKYDATEKNAATDTDVLVIDMS